MILKADGIGKDFGGLTAVSDVDISVGQNEIVGLIGPNGAGKTTLFNCLTGIVRPTRGTILFQDSDIVPPVLPEARRKVKLAGMVSMAVSMLWIPVFAAARLPDVFFKVETFAAIFMVGLLRIFTAAKLCRGVEWTRGLTFLFAALDLFLAGFWLKSLSSFDGLSFFSVGPQAIQFMPLKPVIIGLSVLLIAYGVWIIPMLLKADAKAVFGLFMRPDSVNLLGISRTFQNIRLFGNLSALDNVKIGMHGIAEIEKTIERTVEKIAGDSGKKIRAIIKAAVWISVWTLWFVGRVVFRNKSFYREEADITAKAMAALKFVGLEHAASTLASNLPYGDQRRLEIARALASKPKLLLLDEPAAGMNPQETAGLVRLIDNIRKTGVSILVIEHDMKVIMRICDRIVVLDHGEKIAEGAPSEIRANPKVVEAYLGRSAAHV